MLLIIVAKALHESTLPNHDFVCFYDYLCMMLMAVDALNLFWHESFVFLWTSYSIIDGQK